MEEFQTWQNLQYSSEYVRYVPVVLIEPFTLGTILAFA